MLVGSSSPVFAVLLLGPTGSGKRPLGDAIARRGFLGHRACRLDFGAALRSAAENDSSCSTDQERSFLREVLLARKIISPELLRLRFRADDVLVLNGIPRHAGQAEDISAPASIVALIVLDCSADVVSCRLRDNVGEDRFGRTDDGHELVQKKLAPYCERTALLVDHYERSAYRIYRISVGGRTTLDDAHELLSRLASSDPPASLVAEPPER